MPANRPLIAIILALGLLTAGVTQAQPPPAIKLIPDFASAKAMVRLYQQGSVDKAEMDNLLLMDGVRAVIAQAQRFDDGATAEVFESGLRLSVTGEEVPQPDVFQFNSIRKKMTGIEKTMAWIENNPADMSKKVLKLISPYSPISKPLQVRFFVVLGGNSDGWTRDGVFHTALQYFGDDVEGLQILLSHELYHIVQREFMSPLVHDEDTKQGRVEYLLQKTIWEGMASYVCNPLDVEGGGSYIEWYSKKYQRNLNHLKLNFDLFETLVYRAYHDPDASLRDLYKIGFSGSLESPAYFVGFAMARDIETISGRETLLNLMQKPSAEFFAHYAEITTGEEAQAIALSAGFQGILKELQGTTAE